MSSGAPHRRVSLRDIADEIGISHVSVSLALRDSPRVSEDRKKQIREVAERLGYRPDPMLAALAAYRQNKAGTPIHSALAWLNQWPDKSELRKYREFDAYWKGASESAEKLGYRLDEFQIEKNLTGARLTTILKTRNIRGILIPPHSYGIKLEGFDWKSFSIVRFGFSVREPHVHLVTSDMVGNTMMAYDAIQQLNYQRIGFVTDIGYNHNTRYNAHAGYRAAQDLHVAVRAQIPPLLLDVNNPEYSAKALSKWLKRYKPDGILTTISELRERIESLGYKTPDDIGIAGTTILDAPFDTGIDQHSFEIGRIAVGQLSGLIHEGDLGLPSSIRRTMVEGSWVQGESMPMR